MLDNVKTIAAAALTALDNVEGDVTNEEALKGMILALLFVAKSVYVEKDSFFDGLNKAWDSMNVPDEVEA